MTRWLPQDDYFLAFVKKQNKIEAEQRSQMPPNPAGGGAMPTQSQVEREWVSSCMFT